MKQIYRWIILFIGFAIMAVPTSLVNTIHTLFVQPVTAALGISLTAFSFLFSLSAIINALVSPIIGWLLHQMPLKLLMTISAICVGGGFAAYGSAENIYHFYIIASIIAIGMTGLTTIPVSAMLTNWFGNKCGAAIGIAFAGTGLGSFLWMNMTAHFILTHGYEYAYRILGVIILFITIPLCLLAKLKPVQHELTVSEKNIQPSNYRQLLNDRQIQLFALGLVGLGIVGAGIQIHVQSYLIISGFSLEHNAQIGSMIALAALAWNLIIGMAFDRLSTLLVLKQLAISTAISILSLFFFHYESIHYLFAVLFGSLLAMSALWPTYGVRRVFAHYDYSTVLGLMNLFFVSGAAIGTTLSGIIADSAWGYQTAWFIYFCFFIIYMYIFMRPFQSKN